MLRKPLMNSENAGQGMSVGGAWPGHDHTNDAERDFGRRGDSCGRIYREVKLAPVSSKQQVVLNSDQGTPGSAKWTVLI